MDGSPQCEIVLSNSVISETLGAPGQPRTGGVAGVCSTGTACTGDSCTSVSCAGAAGIPGCSTAAFWVGSGADGAPLEVEVLSSSVARSNSQRVSELISVRRKAVASLVTSI